MPKHRIIILTTGSNKGIGFEVVRQLAAAGHTVILTARNAEKGNEAVHRLNSTGLNAFFLPLDVSDENSIRQAAVTVKEKFQRLDVLINNAAILLKEDVSLSTDDDRIFEQTWRTNVLGPLLMIKYFLPLMPEGSRIINTSSGGGSMTDPVGGWSPAYCVSKSALNAMTRHLAFELAPRNISVNAYCPGWVRTDMGGKSAPRTVEQGADTAVWLATADVRETGKFFRDRTVIPW
ncbi:MAG: SDR family oxidoreductase [Cyclobacteriaceae bacterium]|nr:SDR family oxidoreductase [Cyclobacteriaceae bacterium]MCX7636608.1 SDR family oxidoreductase [Cyclobacteriaceae bacterium]MDW8331954.1 SDR family oxidoreductase [Cyclobacteriaceae bacterium]